MTRDLDEYTIDELIAELARRQQLRADGRCDYCGQQGDSPPCRFPGRHAAASPQFRRAAATTTCEKCGKLYMAHPVFGVGYDGQAYLHVLCDGSYVKL